ncbi:MAG: copper-containing nitrite reductase [Ramlibacter sp.]
MRPPSLRALTLSLLCTGLWASPAGGQTVPASSMPRVTQQLVAPPQVPQHSQTPPAQPRVVAVRMVVEEKEIEVEPGVHVWVFAFNGSVPGPLIVVHEGDDVELTLVNPKTNSLPHNIDFHAATGALGGGELTLINPGEQVVLRWKAVKPGAFVYHCAPGGPMTPWHVVHGMNGAVLVLPRNGLRDDQGQPLHYDRAYYIGEQDFYLPRDEAGKFKRYANPVASFADDLQVMRGLVPTHLVFEGARGALTGDHAMTAKVGETVLFVHSQANRPSYPHLIGGHGDFVWERGNLGDRPQTGLESWVIAAGSAGVFTYTFRQPGTYVYLTHNLIEAVLLGAAAHVKVEGAWDNTLMQQVRKPFAVE